MTKESFSKFIEKLDLYAFDGLIEVTLNDGEAHRAVWITTLPELKPSVDGSFSGKEEIESFYLLDSQQYVTWSSDQIEKLVCIQANYLK